MVALEFFTNDGFSDGALSDQPAPSGVGLVVEVCQEDGSPQ